MSEPHSLFTDIRNQLAKGECYFTALDALHIAEYLAQRLRLDSEYHGLTGKSSDALVVAAITGEGPYITEYPLDRGDWRRCLLAYLLAPEILRERMRPGMRAYKASLDPKHRRIGFCQFPKVDYLAVALDRAKATA